MSGGIDVTVDVFYDATEDDEENDFTSKPTQGAEPSLSQLSTHKWTRTEHVRELPCWPQAMRVINNQLWCCHGEGICIYDSELRPVSGVAMADTFETFDGKLTKHRTIPGAEMDCCRDVAQMDNGDVVVAADGGLFHLTSSGSRGGKRTRQQIEDDQFVAVQVHNGIIYAAKRKAREIRVFEHASSWKLRTCFAIPCSEDNWISLSVQNNTVMVCRADENLVHIFSLKGKLLKTFGETTISGTGEIGTFDWPNLCDESNDGALLFADSNNDRLQVMDANHKWSIVCIDPQIKHPRFATSFANKLFVVSSADDTVYSYTHD